MNGPYSAWRVRSLPAPSAVAMQHSGVNRGDPPRGGVTLPMEKRLHGLERFSFWRMHSSEFPFEGSSNIII